MGPTSNENLVPLNPLAGTNLRSLDHTANHHHQVPDLEQTLAAMPLQTSLSPDNFKKFKPLLCPPVAELQRLSRNVILCLPLSRLPSTFPVKDKNSKPLRNTANKKHKTAAKSSWSMGNYKINRFNTLIAILALIKARSIAKPVRRFDFVKIIHC